MWLHHQRYLCQFIYFHRHLTWSGFEALFLVATSQMLDSLLMPKHCKQSSFILVAMKPDLYISWSESSIHVVICFCSFSFLTDPCVLRLSPKSSPIMSILSTEKSFAGKNWFSRHFLFAFEFDWFSHLNDVYFNVDLLTSFVIVEVISERGKVGTSKMEVLAWRRGWKKQGNAIKHEDESMIERECVSEKGRLKHSSLKWDKF